MMRREYTAEDVEWLDAFLRRMQAGIDSRSVPRRKTGPLGRHTAREIVCLEISQVFDVNRLYEEFVRLTKDLEPLMTGPTWGGWSVQSASGDYRDGWAPAYKAYRKDADGKEFFDEELAREVGYRPRHEHVNPTQIQQGYISEVMRALAKYRPVRTRLVLLRSHAATDVHRDALDNEAFVRLHLPIMTNPGCYYEADGRRFHMRPGQCYLIGANRPHRAANDGDTDRVHLVADVTV